MKIFVKQRCNLSLAALFGLFILLSFLLDFLPGQDIACNFAVFLWHMARIMPCVFLLIGLFDAWVSRETIEKHLGQEAGAWSYVWVLLLGSTTVGGLHVALPVAHALRAKGARLDVVLTLVSAGAVCRVPMTLFEASFVGWKFTLVRFAVSLPLVVLTSILVGRYFEQRHYQLPVQE